MPGLARGDTVSAGSQSESEPSLDEILASIRRIISEEGPAVAAASEALPRLRPAEPAPAMEAPANDVLVLTRRAPPVVNPEAAPAPVSAKPVPDWLARLEPREAPVVVEPPPAPEASTGVEEAPAPASLHDVAPPPAEVEPPAVTWPSPEPTAALGVQVATFEAERAHPVSSPEPDDTAADAFDPGQAPALEAVHAPAPALSAEPTFEEEEDAAINVAPETEAAAGDAFERLASQSAPEGRRESPTMPAPGRSLEDVVRELLRPLIKEWLDENLPDIVRARIDEEIERIARRRVR